LAVDYYRSVLNRAVLWIVNDALKGTCGRAHGHTTNY
jgi:hypothetical protein